MAEKACKLLREVDDLFTDGNVDVTKYNAFTACHSYCPYEKRGKKQILRECKDNNERINALGVHLYKKLLDIANKLNGKGGNANRHIEIFMMWLGDKLCKLEKNKAATLEESYKKYLEGYTGNYKYWNLLGSKQEYKIANVWYMRELYSLLNCICNIVIEYNKKDKNNTKIEQISSKCYLKFINIYKNIKDCYSYFHLLKYLKNIYDDIRNYAIQKDNELKDAIRKNAVRRAAIISDAIKKANITPPVKDSSKLLEYVLNASTISLVDLTTLDWNQRFPYESDHTLDLNTQKCMELHYEFVKHVKKDTSKNIEKVHPQLGSNQLGKEGNKIPQNQQIEILPPQPSSQNGLPLQKSQKGAPDDGNGNPGGANDPPSNTSGGASNFGAPIFEFLLNGREHFNKASNFIEQARQMYNGAKDKITGAYISTVDNLKDAYDKSSTYFNKCISNVIDQLSKIDTPSKSGDKQSGPCNPMGGGNISNHPPSTPLSIPAISTKPQKQVPHQSQPITQQSLQIDPPKHKTADNTNLQLVKSQNTDPNLKKKWNLLPTTWNGSVECEPKINFINITLVCCTSEQCSLTGILVTAVLIPIILLIVYKCLSRERTKKSVKKSMKRVINLANRNRKTKIIIGPSDRNKDLKPIINSAGRKKDSLLNIYKLMQADPIPFINLFFLLIFFVYKKKLNYLEL